MFNAELWAILDALELSITKIRNDNLSIITIFIDSRAAITNLHDSKAKTRKDIFLTLIYENVYKIKSSGHILILRWVSSYSKIPENAKMDISAKNMAQKRRRQTDYLSFFTFLKSELRKIKLAELVLCYQRKIQEQKTILQRFYILIVKESISLVFGKALKKFVMWFY